MERLQTQISLVLPMSGGLDSFIAYYYAVKEYGFKEKQIVPVFFDLGQPYKDKELKAIGDFPFAVTKLTYNLINEEAGNIPTIDNQIIAGRNLIFAVLSAHLGNKLWICALDGEIHDFMPDKSNRFFAQGSDFLSYIFEKPFTLETPFKDLSKKELIEWALNNGIEAEALKKTNTCYHPIEWNCGKCSACFKRKIAMSLNGIDEDYKADPFDKRSNSYRKKYVPLIRRAYEKKNFNHYNEKRCIETMLALGERW